MRVIKVVTVSFSLVAIIFFVSACGDSNCLSCDEGQPCPDFSGEYYGMIDELSDDCVDWNLVTGDHYLRIISQTTDASGQTAIEAEDKDKRGIWGTLSGYLCNTEDTEYPMYYPFTLSRSYMEDDGSSDTYSLNGTLSVGTPGDKSSYSFSGTLTITVTSSTGTACTLMGSVNGNIL